MLAEKAPYTSEAETPQMHPGPAPKRRNSPLNLWEIDNSFKCPVIGICIPYAEQKQLLKKAGFPIKKANPFEIHEALVGASDSENRLSKRMDALLNRKFGREVKTLHGLTAEAFMDRFKDAFEAGTYPPVFWAAAIHPELPVEMKRKVFGKIHMAMHGNGEQDIRMKRRIARLESDLQCLREESSAAAQHRRSLQKENESLNRSNSRLKTALAAAETEIAALAGILAETRDRGGTDELEEENRRLKAELTEHRKRSAEDRRRMRILRQTNACLSSDLRQIQDSHQRCMTEAHEIISEFGVLNRCDTECPSFDLCQKRILLVGGMTRMESLYRELIESSGGIFDYHDGYMKKGVKKLESCLRRADVVLCPVSCNSHAACSLVKNLAKKHKKRVHMLPNSSLSTVSQVLSGENADGRTIN